jgi:hypothetical protein
VAGMDDVKPVGKWNCVVSGKCPETSTGGYVGANQSAEDG